MCDVQAKAIREEEGKRREKGGKYMTREREIERVVYRGRGKMKAGKRKGRRSGEEQRERERFLLH